MIEQSVHLVPGLSPDDIETIDVDVWRHELRLRRPFRTARETITTRESVIVRVQAQIAGFSVTGWGEAAPLPGWSIERLSEVRFELARLRDMVLGGASSAPLDLLARLSTPTARFAFTTALLDAIGHARRRPLRQLIDRAAPHSIPVNATIGLETPQQTVALAREAWACGFRTLKLKVGDADDMERVVRVREALPDVVLRLDANAAWDEATALARLHDFAGLEIDYVEQPVADVAQLERLRGRTRVPIAADESCLPITSAQALVAARAVDVIVLKPALLGAWADTFALVEAARDAGIRVVFTSALDSMIGRTATAQIAAATLGEVACGLATNWFETDLGEREDRVRDGRLYLGSGNGLGLSLDPSFLKPWNP